MKFRSLMLGLAVAGTGWPSPADAAGSAPVSVTVAVVSSGHCTFNGLGNLSASLDPAATTAIFATGFVTFRCIGGGPSPLTYGISNNSGQNGASPSALALRHTVSTSQTIGYSLGYTGSASVAKNLTHTASLTATFVPSAFQNAVPGTYTDAVIFTISP